MKLEFGWIFTNLLTMVGVLYGWINPIIGLMVYYAFSVLRPTFLWFWSWPDLNNTPRYSWYVAMATLIGWAMSGFGKWTGLRNLRFPLFGLALYLGWGCVAAQLFAINSQRAWDFLDPQLKIGLMMLVTISLVRDAKHIRAFAWLMVAALGYLAWVFNSQYYFDGYNRVWINGFGSIDNNGTAMIMVMGVPLAFFMGIFEKRWWVKLLCFFAVGLMVHVILFSFSRGGQLGLCMVGLAIFLVAITRLPNKVITILAAVFFTAAAVHLAGPEVRERFFSIFVDKSELDASAASRFDTWRAAIRCMKDHPLGVGPRNFNLISGQYGLVYGKSVHNLFLQTGADYGILGMLGLLVFYVGSILKTFRMTKTRTAARLVWPQYFGHMVCISLAGFFICSMFIGMESVEVGYIVAMLGLCTVSYVDRIAAVEPASRPDILPELAQVATPGEAVPF